MEKFICYDPDIKGIVKHHLVDFFTINTPFEPESKFEEIWEHIMSAAEYQSQWERQLPARWLIFERELMKRRAEGIKIMTLRDILVLSESLETESNGEEDTHVFLRLEVNKL